MATFSRPVLNFLRACEALRGRLAGENPLTPDEQDTIERTALELLRELQAERE